MVNVTINGIGMFSKTAEIFREMLEDNRINESVRNEYRAAMIEAIDSWAQDQKAPENRAMKAPEETKGLCDNCSYYRPLVKVKEHHVCELCVDLYV